MRRQRGVPRTAGHMQRRRACKMLRIFQAAHSLRAQQSATAPLATLQAAGARPSAAAGVTCRQAIRSTYSAHHGSKLYHRKRGGIHACACLREELQACELIRINAKLGIRLVPLQAAGSHHAQQGGR